jgi:hypothetical protein
MYFFPMSGSHGQVESTWPGASGAPTECMHGIKLPLPSTSSTRAPMRVMMRILVTTYALSVICTPILAMGEPNGPMLNGITYSVRPLMQPLKMRFEGGAHFFRSCPIVGRASFVFGGRADEGPLFNTGHV